MATLQNIRNRGGLLVAIVIGLALGAFILGDMLNSGNKLMRPSQMKIAEIDGESIQYPEFQKKVEELSEIYKMNTRQTQIDEATWSQIREQVWQSYLQENIMSKASEELGLAVTSDELLTWCKEIILIRLSGSCSRILRQDKWINRPFSSS